MKLNTHVIAQTENNLLSGVVVGTATTVASPFHEGSGNLIQEYVVRLDEPFDGTDMSDAHDEFLDAQADAVLDCTLTMGTKPWSTGVAMFEMKRTK